MPLIVFGMDMPFSFLFVQSHSFLYPHLALRTAMLIDGAIFTVGGAMWFYALGLAILKLMAKLRSR